MADEKTGAFISSLKRNNKQIREDRAISIGEDALTIVKEYNKRSMQRVIEVYNFSLDIDMQLNQGRAYNL